LTSLVDRDEEASAVCALLLNDGVRLLTLIGPGGVGKTRLALRVAQDAACAFANDVCFVPLSAFSEPSLVMPTIAWTLGLREDATRSAEESLASYLGARRLLLVLDNFEQVRAAAHPLAMLLAACPNLVALVTSRAPLHVAGEQRFPVLPLALPVPVHGDCEGCPLLAIAASPAVQLFVVRAQAIEPRFSLDEHNATAVAAICDRLDGLPLAIELAAARTGLLCPAELLARLDRALPLLAEGPEDAPTRLRTMRRAIAWSYDLLPPAAQGFFRRLSIFSGGFTIEGAESVGGEGGGGGEGGEKNELMRSRTPAPPERSGTPSTPSPLDLLAALVDVSLVRRIEAGGCVTWFDMPQVIQEFGRERLEAAGELDAVARRHAAYYLDLAEAATGEALPGDPIGGLDRLDGDLANLRAAFDHWHSVGDVEACLRFAAACAPFWFARGHVREGWARLRDALAAVGPAPPGLRGRALVWAVELALPTGNRQAAAALGQEAVAVWRTLDDSRGLAAALHARALVVEQAMEWEAAAALLAEELVLRRQLAEPLHLGIALVLLGGVAFGQGDLVQATALVEEGGAMARAAGSRRWMGLAEWYLGMFAASERQVATAARHYRDSLCALSEVEEHVCRFKPIVGLAAMATESHRPQIAANLLGAADKLLQDRGMELYPFDRPAHALAATAGRASLGEDGFAAACRAGRHHSRDELMAAAGVIVAAAEERERPTNAIVSAGAALTTREREVLRHLVRGWSDREIGAALFISQRTASAHVSRIMRKLNAATRTAAVAEAVRGQLV
jgi:non-specific serine/threonine protein kinase